MRTPVKVGLIAAGYAGAVLVSAAAVAIYVAWTDGPDRQNYGGMYAFGDSLLFLAVFGGAAVLPTAAALFSLRSWRPFWIALTAAGLSVAATGLGACIVYIVSRGAGDGSFLHSWSAFAVLRLLVAPLFSLFFLLSAALAPDRRFRMPLFVACLVEAAAFVCAAVALFQPFGSR